MTSRAELGRPGEAANPQPVVALFGKFAVGRFSAKKSLRSAAERPDTRAPGAVNYTKLSAGSSSGDHLRYLKG